MKNWKTKMFGDNAMNFYGWLFSGSLAFATSAYFLWRALRGVQQFSPTEFLLLGIYMLLVGVFGIVWHNYLARLAEKLDAPDKADDRTR